VEIREVQTTEHLGRMRFIEGRDNLRIGNDGIINKQVEAQRSWLRASIVNREGFRLIDPVPAFDVFDNQGAPIKLFGQARFERV